MPEEMNVTLNPQQTAQRFILNLYGQWQDDERLQGDLSAEQIAEFWDELDDDLQDARNEARWRGDEVSGLRERIHFSWSRNYEVDVRVIHLGGDRGLAYNMVTGGGKHGEPDAYPWWQEAWFVKCTGSKTVTTVTHTYEDVPEVTP